MSLNLDIVVKGTEQVVKLTKSLEQQAVAFASIQKNAEGASKGTKKMAKDFELFAKSLGVSSKELQSIVESMKAAKAAMAQISKPFSSLAKNATEAINQLKKFKQTVEATNATTRAGLNDKMFTKQIVDGKAMLALQKQLNTAIERQAALKAKLLLTQPDKISDPTMKALVEDVLKAEKGVATLNARLEKTAAAKAKVAATPMINPADIAMKDLSAPFVKMEMSTNKLISSVGILNKELQRTAAITKTNLGNSAYMGMVKNSKAAILAQQKVNAEIEKQAALTLKLNMIRGSGGSKGLAPWIANLKTATTQTEKLTAQYRKFLMEAQKGAKGSQLAHINKELQALDGNMSKASGSTKNFGTNMKFALGGIARSMGAMTYSYAALAPLLAGIAAGSTIKNVYALGDAFEYTTTYVEALKTSMEGLDATGIQDQILGSETLRKGPQEMAAGMKEFAKAGVDAAMSMRQIGEMSKFATIAEIELGDAVKLVVGQSQAFDQSFVKSANVISAAALSSATDIQELGTALSYTTELATVSGTTFEEVATAMALMANAGIRGSKAGTAIRTSILKMQNPTAKLKGMLDDLGLSWSAFTEDGRVKDMRSMFTELQRVTEKLPDQQRVAVMKELFGLRALKGGANILKSMGGEWDKMYDKINKAGKELNFVSDTYGKLEDTVTAKREKLASEFQKTLIGAFDSEGTKGILDNLIDVAGSEAFAESLRSSVEAMNSLAGAITKTAGAVAVLTNALPGLSAKIKNVVKAISPLGRLKSFVPPIAEGYLEQLDRTANYWLEIARNKKAAETPTADAFEQGTKMGLYEIDTEEVAQRFTYLEGRYEEFLKKVSPKPWGVNDTDWAAQMEAEFPKQEFFDKWARLVPVDIEVNIPDSVGSEMEELQARLQRALGSDTTSVMIIDNIQAKIDGLKETVQKLPEHRELSAEELKKFDAVLEKMSFSKAILGIEGIALAEKKAEQAAIMWGKGLKEALGATHPKVKEMEAAMLDLAKAQGLEKIKQATKELDFNTVVNGLKSSKDASDQLEGALMSLQHQAEKTLKDNLVDFDSTEGKEYFKALVEGSQLFEKAIDSADKKVRDLQYTMDDLSFNFDADIFAEKLKIPSETMRFFTGDGIITGTIMKDDKTANYKNQLSQIDKLQAAAREASMAGEDGWKRQLDLLKQAYGIAKSMDATKNVDVLKAKAASAKATMQKFQGSLTSMAATSKKAYFEAQKAVKAAERGDVDKGRQNKKISEMQELQKMIMDVQSTRKTMAEEEREGINELQKKYTDMWMSTEDATKAATEAAESYGRVIDASGKVIAEMPVQISALQAGLEGSAKTAAELAESMKGVIPEGMGRIFIDDKVIISAGEQIVTAWKGGEVATKDAQLAADDYMDTLNESTGTFDTWSSKAVSDIDKVTAAMKELAKATNDVGTPNSSVDGARADGGPVHAGGTFVVGERGPELFTPRASGHIIPNHEMNSTASKSEGTMEVNLNVGGETVKLQGSISEVEKFNKIQQRNKKFASN